MGNVFAYYLLYLFNDRKFTFIQFDIFYSIPCKYEKAEDYQTVKETK